MEIKGKVTVERPPEELWDLLLDPDVLRECMPGCEHVERETEYTYRVRMRVGVGFFKTRFQGRVQLRDVVREKGYTLELKAQGAAGRVEGRTTISLSRVDGTQTELEYEGRAQVSGALGSLGGQIFRNAAVGFQEEFFNKLAKL